MQGVTSVTIANRALAMIGTRSNIQSLTDAKNEAYACNLHYANTRDQLLAAAGWGFAKATLAPTLAKSGDGSTPLGVADFSQSDFNANDFSVGTVGWDGSLPPPQWLYEYLVPLDCLCMLYLVPQPTVASTGIPIFSCPTSIEPAVTGAIKYERGTDMIPVIQTAAGQTLSVPQQTNVFYCNTISPLLCYVQECSNEALWDMWFVEAMVAGLASRICMQLSGKMELSKQLEATANQLVMKARERDSNQNLQVIDQVPDWMRVRGVVGYEPFSPVCAYGPLLGNFYG